MTRPDRRKGDDLDLEVAVALQAAARLAQERTQRRLRAVAVLTAVILLVLSTATLAYVAVIANESRRISERNRELLAAFQAEQKRDAEADADASRLAEQRFGEALATLSERADASDERITRQLQLVLDLLIAEVRDPNNRERRGEPALTPRPRAGHDHHRHPHPRPQPRPRPSSSSRPTPRPTPAPSPTPRPSPTCATGAPVLGLCLPPPPRP